MKANYEDKILQQTSEVTLGNLYEVNQQLMMREIALSSGDKERVGAQLKEWFTELFAQKYFMLLCQERKDYTLFNLDKTNTWKAPEAATLDAVAQDVFECLDNRGNILSAERQETGAWEFWIRDNDDQCAAYYLFPYGAAVLEY